MLTIERGDALHDLSGLATLREVGTLGLKGNAGLQSLDGMPNLRKVDSLFVEENPALVSLHGLDDLAAVTYQASITRNTSLSQCEVAELAARLPNVAAHDNGPSGTCEP